MVELKGIRGSRAVALSECLVSSVACVNVVKVLNELAKRQIVGPADRTAFSIAINEFVGIMYIM